MILGGIKLLQGRIIQRELVTQNDNQVSHLEVTYLSACLSGGEPGLPAAAFRTVFDRAPVVQPGFTPAHFPAALLAGLAGQMRFVAFE